MQDTTSRRATPASADRDSGLDERRREPAARAPAAAERLRCWPFIHSSFFVSKIAAFFCSPPREKSAIISSSDITSRSPPGDHPMSARKFTIAPGRIPSF